MKDKNTLSIKDPDILFLSYFGIGFFPFAPGTAGTIATLPVIYYLGAMKLSLYLLVAIVSFLTIISCFIADYTQKRKGLHDPGWIVIDEVVGMLTAWLFYLGSDFIHIGILFVLFRFFDIIKFWPASYFDKTVKHGAGTILDDTISGIFAGVCYKLITYFILF